MTVEQNKAALIRGAEAFNNLDDRSGWFDIHDPGVLAYGLAPEPLDLEHLRAQVGDPLLAGAGGLEIFEGVADVGPNDVPEE